MAKYLKSDEDIRKIRTEKELAEYIAFRKSDDHWYAPNISEITAVGIENMPLKISEMLEEYHLPETNSVMETIQNYGIFLKFPHDGKEAYIPIRYTAFPGLCKVSGTSCRAVTNYTPRAKDRVLPLQTKVEWITAGCRLRDIPCKILLRDEKVSSVVTRRYAILPQWELLDALTGRLDTEFQGKYEFDEAIISHDYSCFSYRIDDEEMIDSVKGFLQNCHINCNTVTCGVCMATSDIGLSRAYAYLYIEYDGIRIQLSDVADVIHDFGNTVETFSNSMVNIGTAFHENEDQIEELGNTPISDISSCIKNILEAYPLFPAKTADTVLQSIAARTGNVGTAADCFLSFFEMADLTRKNGEDNLRLYLEMMQRVSKLLWINYKAFDK